MTSPYLVYNQLFPSIIQNPVDVVNGWEDFFVKLKTKRAAIKRLFLFLASTNGLFCADADFAFLDTLSDNFISNALWNSFVLLEDHRERTATLRDRTNCV